MRATLSRRLIRAALAAGVAGGVLLLTAGAENDFFQFCTTKAYGWPAPWRIEYCLCGGGGTVRPASSRAVNLGLAAGAGLAGFLLGGGGSGRGARAGKEARPHPASRGRAPGSPR